MQIDMSPILSGKASVIAIDYPLSIDFDFPGIVFSPSAQVLGEIRDRAGYISLSCTLTVSYQTVCDRCLAPLEREISFPFQRTVAEKKALQEKDIEESDEYVVIEDGMLNLDPLLSEALLLQLPTKHLCREDCLGLCPKCGKDLNEGPCSCTEEKKDPRWEAVRQKLAGRKE